jgi:hypothetical protein
MEVKVFRSPVREKRNRRSAGGGEQKEQKFFLPLIVADAGPDRRPPIYAEFRGKHLPHLRLTGRRRTAWNASSIMEIVYIETTIVSYLVAKSNRDPILSAHQRLTQLWWQDQRQFYQCVISEETLAEAARGDTDQARLRLDALRELPVLAINADVENLAVALLESGSMPPVARSDAIHVAAATLAGVDFLLTWNCRHLANPHLMKRLRAFIAERGLTLPEICTPVELDGE